MLKDVAKKIRITETEEVRVGGNKIMGIVRISENF